MTTHLSQKDILMNKFMKHYQQNSHNINSLLAVMFTIAIITVGCISYVVKTNQL